jgi:hypothetical protein
MQVNWFNNESEVHNFFKFLKVMNGKQERILILKTILVQLKA